MSVGLIALLDDVVALAKVAATSLDDIAAQAAKAGAKAAGVVVDDAAVTPRYLVGFAAHRELPIVWRIAVGSLRNKLLFLLPGALALGFLAPWAITPLLALGGCFLCYEGAEKVAELIWPETAHATAVAGAGAPTDPATLEQRKINSAIKTDFILSAEVMAITLSGLGASSFWAQALILALVGTGITVVVYGAVALIVKADDAGVALAANIAPATSLLGLRSGPFRISAVDEALGPVTRALGRGLVRGMPPFLILLGLVGMAAMLWVGGGILLHALEAVGVTGPAHHLAGAAATAGQAMPALGGLVEWLVGAAGAGLFGLMVGAALVPLVHRLVVPLWLRLRGAAASVG